MLQCSYNVNTVSCLLHTVNAQLQYDMVLFDGRKPLYDAEQ